MADAITDAMIEAGVAAWDFTLTTGELVERIYLAMEAARQPQLPSDDGLIKALEEIVAKDRTGFGRAALANVAREALSRHKAPLSVAGDDVERAFIVVTEYLADKAGRSSYPTFAFNSEVAWAIDFLARHASTTALQVTEGDKLREYLSNPYDGGSDNHGS